MTTVSIEDVSAMLADEGQYPASKGYRNPANPAWTCFDDEHETDPDILWGRELALDFEEFVARRNHEEALDSRKENYARIINVPVRAPEPVKLVPAKNADKIVVPPTKADKARAAYLTRKVASTQATSRQIHDDYEGIPEELLRQHFELCEYTNLKAVIDDEYNRDHPVTDENGAVTNPYLGIKLQKRNGKPASKEDIEAAQGLSNWLVGWAKRTNPTNDHWRKLVMPLVGKLDDPVLGETAKTILATLKRELPFAPGPIAGTTFVNPDGSRFQTAGISPGSAKASFIKRHKLDEEFVSVDRVQYEGERNSRYVVGTRRSGETTPSRYYDPNPAWQDTVRKTGYLPNAAAFLIKLDESMVMPSGSHRLTVREFEQAIIAGCDILEDAFERTAYELEEEYLPDARVLMINVGYGNAQNDPMIFSHEEEYLLGVFRKFAKDADDAFWKDAIEKLMLRDEAADILRDHFHEKGGKPSPQLVDLLDFISWSDKNTPSDSGPYLPYAIATLSQYGEEEYQSRVVNSYSAAVALFDDDEDAWSIPTGPNGACKLGSFRNWK